MTKSEQARINGAKSKGPVTPEGKKTSSRNSLKHGFAATQNVVISLEDEPEWNLHRDSTRASFKPKDYVELELVDKLASISWRQSRLVATETALIDAQLEFQEPQLRKQHPTAADDPYAQLLYAWQGLATQPQKAKDEKNDSPLDLNSIELVRHYQVSLDRQYRNALLNLRQYRKDFAEAEPQPKAEVLQAQQPKPLKQPALTEPAKPTEPHPSTDSTAPEPAIPKLPRAA